MVLVRPDMGIFGLYVGLTASAYNLARIPDGDPLESVLRAIGMAQWPRPARKYFAQAKRPGRGINPYWPRAAMLLEACIYLGSEREFRHSDELQLLRAIAAFPVSDDEKDSATVEWVRAFPPNYNLITETDLFPLLWASYLAALESTLRVFEAAALATLESFLVVTGASEESLPELVVVPNPLQAPQVADFVRKDGTIFVVVAKPGMSAIVHELLHNVLSPILRTSRREIVSCRHLLRPVLPEVLRMQYAWGDDEESWFRVFEESLMRAAAIWVEHAGSKDRANREAALHADQGFIYVPAMLRCLREGWPGPGRAAGFVSSCLKACTTQAGAARR